MEIVLRAPVINIGLFCVSQTLCLGGAPRSRSCTMASHPIPLLFPLGISQTIYHTQTIGWHLSPASRQCNRDDQGSEGFYKRYTKEDRLLTDRSKRIHTVIHMQVEYRNEEDQTRSETGTLRKCDQSTIFSTIATCNEGSHVHRRGRGL
jgi:hypothetical protein